MLNLRPEDILHKSHLHRLLIEILDQPRLSLALAFKGGSCAALLGYLDRFSVDLDFDLLEENVEDALRLIFHKIFDQLGYTLALEFEHALLFQLRYPARPGGRSTLKVDASSLKVESNEYRVMYLPEIDRLARCQTIETMFANKLVAVTDRFEQHGSIAGRDIYDLHHFFVQGYAYRAAVIQVRTGLTPVEYLARLTAFVKEKVTQKIINEDLDSLLLPSKFQQVRKILIPETIALLENEHRRLVRQAGED